MAVVALAAALYGVLFARAATPIPVFNGTVVVKTKSGSVQRTTIVPVGGVGVPIDVDDGLLLGNLAPDINVGVALVSLASPGSPLVPQIIVRRDATAVALKHPAPPLEIDVALDLRDAANGGKQLAEIHYGFTTPPGAKTPSLVKAKLTGPVQGGFVDPLIADIETPGHHAPLKFTVSAETESNKAVFNAEFDPLPPTIHIVQDPHQDAAGNDDGFDLLYEHSSPETEVELDAQAELTDKQLGTTTEATANVQRLPYHVGAVVRSTDPLTTIDIDTGTQAGKPDIEATVSQTKGDDVLLDATVRAAGVPQAFGAVLKSVKNDQDEWELDGVSFDVVGDEQVDSVDFEAQNHAGDVLPQVELGPDQFVSLHAKRQSEDLVLTRAAGHVEGLRSIAYERVGDRNGGLDLVTDLGDGVKPLRAVTDLDKRGPGQAEDDARARADSTITPLAQVVHARIEPKPDDAGQDITYEASSTVDVRADVLTAGQVPSDACGDVKVTCARAVVDDLPGSLTIALPGETGTDYAVTHGGPAGANPDVRAVVDVGPDGTANSKRTWADLDLTDIPNTVRGRVDITDKGIVRAAEFHGCDWDFAADAPGCASGGAPAPLGRVDFTVRDRPQRGDLPARKDTAVRFVSLIRRASRSEVVGSMEDVRSIAFRQRDTNPDDDKSDGVLGVSVNVGQAGAQFDTVMDSIVPAESRSTKADIKVHELPTEFSVCLREPQDAAAPEGERPADALLEECEGEVDGMPLDESEPAVTPLSVVYRANTETKLDADLELTGPASEEDPTPVTRVIDTTVSAVPTFLRTDLIPPVQPDEEDDEAPTRRLRLRYHASRPIDELGVLVENRRADAVCEDPRQGRESLCLKTTVKNLPEEAVVSYDPARTSGKLSVTRAALPAGERFDFDAMRLAVVNADHEIDKPVVVSGHIHGISRAMAGTILQADTSSPPDGEAELATLELQACADPTADPACTGIEDVDITATNVLAADPGGPGDPIDGIDPGPAPTPHDFTYLAREGDYRAHIDIHQFRHAKLDQVNDDGKVTPVLAARAAFGSPGQKVRLYVDKRTAGEDLLVDGLLENVPNAINLCLRDKLGVGQEPLDDGSFCETAPKENMAIQAWLDELDASGLKPNVVINRFVLRRGGGVDHAEGHAKIIGLGRAVQVLAADGKDPDIQVTGRPAADNETDVVAAADRVTFGYQNFSGSEQERATKLGYPWVGLHPGAVDPSTHPNFVKAVVDGDDVLVAGSVSDVRRVALAPGACNGDDDDVEVRYPPLEDYADEHRPQYTCVDAHVGSGESLAVGVRTKDELSDVVAIEDAILSEVPADGLRATIAKSPDKIALRPVCGTPEASDPDTGFPCRPPLLSVEADRAEGAPRPQLQARMALGNQNLLSKALAVEPLDSWSKRVKIQQHPKDYTADGARMVLGRGTTGTAVLASLRLGVPRFLDLDPPTSYSCKRHGRTSQCLVSDPSKTAFGKDANKGFEATDIGFRMAGSESEHYGSDVDFLGRAAILVHTFADHFQVLATGAAPTGDDGTSSVTPEQDAHPEGAHDLGFRLPGYSDVRVSLRDDYEAQDGGKMQHKYVQIDSRTNEPLSLGLRLHVSIDAKDRGFNRDDVVVPGVNIELHDAPPRKESDTHYVEPSFTLRAEVRKAWVDPDPDERDLCHQVTEALAGAQILMGVTPCLIFPDPTLRWLNIRLDADAPGHPPARAIDAVAVPDGAVNDVEIRGWQDPARTVPATFSDQAGMRLEGFDFGLKINFGNGLINAALSLVERGDLMLESAGRLHEYLRLANNWGGVRLKSLGGPTQLSTDLEATAAINIELSVLFGLWSADFDIPFPIPFHHHVLFWDCAGQSFTNTVDEMTANNEERVAAINLAPFGAGFPFSLVTGMLSQITIPVFCAMGAETFNQYPGSPAPRWDDPERPVNGAPPEVQFSPPPAVTPDPPATTPDEFVFEPSAPGESHLACGTVGAKKILVKPGARVRVGNTSETWTRIIGGQPVTVPCTGSLALSGEEIVVEAGAEISADGVVHGGDAPDIGGRGGGAGHGGKGGAAGNGNPGGDAGTHGGAAGNSGDAFTGAGGHGGGKIVLAAQEKLEMHGTVTADGGTGGVSGPDCSDIAGGGGSGGTVELAANRVMVDGTVSVDGGAGGAGGIGGGGGGGGRITVDDIVHDVAQNALSAAPGTGGTSPPACALPGEPGQPGISDGGRTIKQAAWVRRLLDGPPIVRDAELVEISALNPGGGPLSVILCRQSLAPGDPGADEWSTTELLDPGKHFEAKTLFAQAQQCDEHQLPGPDGPTPDSYRELVILDGLPDGFHGYFAVAAEPLTPGTTTDCYPVDAANKPCEYQLVQGETFSSLPDETTLRLGWDATAPVVEIDQQDGIDGCPQGSRCLDSQIATAKIDIDEPVSGVEKTECRIVEIDTSGNEDVGSWFQGCEEGKVSIPLGGEGVRRAEMRASDVAGNVTTPVVEVGTWFVDTVAPPAPKVTVVAQPGDVPVNDQGWHRQKPLVGVLATDPLPSPGFKGDPSPVDLLIDGAAIECGVTLGAIAICEPDDPKVVDAYDGEGRHQFSAQSVDRMGHASPRSEPNEFKVDTRDPVSRLVLGPAKPDGDSNWYTRRPFFAFAVTDGGSGMGPHSKVEYRFDNVPTWQLWDPEDVEASTVPDGIHTLCWRATDTAGNTEDVPHCSGQIKVDTKAPVISESIHPAAPDGDAGWYVTEPQIEADADDQDPGPDPQQVPSGAVTTEVQLDNGPWVPAGSPPAIGEGEHEVRIRAHDLAGNEAQVVERSVRFDATPPTSRAAAFPPAPNDAGWFRRGRVAFVAGSDDEGHSGLDVRRAAVDNAPFSDYPGPFAVGEGQHTVSHFARDVAGHESTPQSFAFKADLTPPVASLSGGKPANLVLPGQTTLGFSASDAATAKVKVRVAVYNSATGQPVRELLASNWGWRNPGAGTVTWDGKKTGGQAVVPGLYHYRVSVSDEARNSAVSTESPPFLVIAAGVPLP